MPATTDQVRIWFRETVRNHIERGSPGFKPQCNWGIAEIAPFPAEGGGTYREPVHPATTEAWDAYIAVMEYHNETLPGSGGVNNCRNIANSFWPSLHAYLVAVDHPPNSRMKRAFISDVEKIRTNNGKQVFVNGAYFNDRMHNQLNCSQGDLSTGIDWSTVKGARDDMVTRGTKVDNGNPSLAANVQEMKARGVFTEHTNAGGVTINDEVATFLVRFRKELLADVRKLIAESGGSGGGLKRGDSVKLT